MIQGRVRTSPQSVALPGGAESQGARPVGLRLPRWGFALALGVRWVGLGAPQGSLLVAWSGRNVWTQPGLRSPAGRPLRVPEPGRSAALPPPWRGSFTDPWRPAPCGPLRMTRSRPRPCAYARRASPRGGRAPGFFSPSPHRPALAEPTGGGVQGDTPRRRPLHGCVQTRRPLQAPRRWPPGHPRPTTKPMRIRAKRGPGPHKPRGFAAISGPATAAPKYSHPPETPDPPAPRPQPPERSARDRPQAHAHHGERGGHAPDPSAPRRTRTP